MATQVPASGHGFRTAGATESTGPNNGIDESAEQGCNTAVANSSSGRSTASPKTARGTPPVGMDDTSAGATFRDGLPSSVKSMSTAFTEASYANLRTETEAPTAFVEPTDSSTKYLSPDRDTATSTASNFSTSHSNQSTKPSKVAKPRHVSGKEQKSSATVAADSMDEAFAFSPRCYTNSFVPNESPKSLARGSRGDKLTEHARNSTRSSTLSSERDTAKDFAAFSPRCFLSSTKEDSVRTNGLAQLESHKHQSRTIASTGDASALPINISIVAQSSADPMWQRCDYIVIPPKHVTFNGHLYERMD